VYNHDGEITGYEADFMKTLTVIILFFTMLMTGCSHSHGHKRSLSPDLQMGDDRRLLRNLPERRDHAEGEWNRGASQGFVGYQTWK